MMVASKRRRGRYGYSSYATGVSRIVTDWCTVRYGRGVSCDIDFSSGAGVVKMENVG